jgi:hypothetical protein
MHRVTQTSVGDGDSYTDPRKRRLWDAVPGFVLLRKLPERRPGAFRHNKLLLICMEIQKL